MNELSLLILIVAACVILLAVGVTVWSRRNPAALRPRPQQPPLARITRIRTTCGVLVPVAEARPRHWTHDAGGMLLSIDWHGRAYLVAAPFVPRGFADHLKRTAPQPAQPPKRRSESVR